MITLGGRSFAGPFLLPFWTPPRSPGLYAVMVPGWRLLTFRALHFGQAGNFSKDELAKHLRYAEWRAIAGSEWNLYVATYEMPFSAEAQRLSVERDVVQAYRPEFSPQE